MAAYQRGDVLNVLDPENDGTVLRVRVEHVIADTRNGDFEDTYEAIITSGDDEGEWVEIVNSDVDEILAGPSFVAPPAGNDTVQDGITAMDALLQAMQPVNLDELRPAPTTFEGDVVAARGIYEQLVGVDPIRNVDPQPIPEPQVVAADNPYLAMWGQSAGRRHRYTLGADLTPQTEPEPQRQPEIERRVPTTSLGVTRNDYRPSLGEVTRLTTFTLREDVTRNIRAGIQLIPQVSRESASGYEFKDTEDNAWVNQFQHSRVEMYSGIRDIFGIHWMLKSEFSDREVARITGNPYSAKPRKKLRHKYGKMPVIKDEKHYAGKEYIA